MKILILEDDRDLLEVFSIVLEPRWDVAGASTVEDALKIVETQAIDIALLDINIGDGTSTAVFLQCLDRKIPCILMTGGQADIPPETFVLRKPISVEDFEDNLRDVLNSMKG